MSEGITQAPVQFLQVLLADKLLPGRAIKLIHGYTHGLSYWGCTAVSGCAGCLLSSSALPPNSLPKKPRFFFFCPSGAGGAGPGWVGAAAACEPTCGGGNAGLPFAGVPGATVACLSIPKSF